MGGVLRHFGKDKNSLWYDYQIYSLVLPQDNDGIGEEHYKPLNQSEEGISLHEEAVEAALLYALKNFICLSQINIVLIC